MNENITEWLKELDPDMADWVAELINVTFNERLEKREARIADLEQRLAAAEADSTDRLQKLCAAQGEADFLRGRVLELEYKLCRGGRDFSGPFPEAPG